MFSAVIRFKQDKSAPFCQGPNCLYCLQHKNACKICKTDFQFVCVCNLSLSLSLSLSGFVFCRSKNDHAHSSVCGQWVWKSEYMLIVSGIANSNICPVA